MPYTCSNDKPFSSERCTLLCPHSTCQTCNNISVCVYIGELTSTLCFCLLLLVPLKLPISSRVTALFILGLFWGLSRSHRLSSHSRLNAFVIQTKLNLSPQHVPDLLHCITQPFKQERAETTTCVGPRVNPDKSYKFRIINPRAIEQ
jgi:hypothetical protein